MTCGNRHDTMNAECTLPAEHRAPHSDGTHRWRDREVKMTATLRYDLSDPQEREEHEHAMRGADYYAALCEIIEAFRAAEKYDMPAPTRTKMREIMECHDVRVP